jgi:polyisoprenoid-binding protein YceI
MTTTEAQSIIPTGSWKLDPVHSTVGFEVAHNLGNFRGSFRDFDVAISVDGDEPKLTGSAKVESVDVELEDLKGHLLSPEFFDAGKYPEIKFESSDVRYEDGKLIVDGELEIAGTRKAVEAHGEVRGPIDGPSGAPTIAVALETTVDRRDYGIDWQMELPSGGDVLGYEVKLTVELELQAQVEE